MVVANHHVPITYKDEGVNNDHLSGSQLRRMLRQIVVQYHIQGDVLRTVRAPVNVMRTQGQGAFERILDMVESELHATTK